LGFDRFGFRDFGFGPRFGFGFGLGFGWGWGCGGWGWPYWGFGWGCPGYWGLGWDYPGWGYPYGDGYGPYGSDDSWIWDNNNAGNYSDYTGDTSNDYDSSLNSGAPSDAGQGAQGSAQPNAATATDPESTPTVVYLKDGTTFQVTSYWSSGNTLHYVTTEGRESSVDVDQIDLQRTDDENAKRGIRFPLTPKPNTPTSNTPAVAPAPRSMPTTQVASQPSKSA
jgi:hypothetical protein